MEIWGIGVDMEGCLKARNIIRRKLKSLEKKAHEYAGKIFSLSMPADIANVLYEHLKLPMPEGYKGKQHPSTDKHCLDMLRYYDHLSIIYYFCYAFHQRNFSLILDSGEQFL